MEGLLLESTREGSSDVDEVEQLRLHRGLKPTKIVFLVWACLSWRMCRLSNTTKGKISRQRAKDGFLLFLEGSILRDYRVQYSLREEDDSRL